MTTTLDLAAAACERHADVCGLCDVPNVDRGNAGCRDLVGCCPSTGPGCGGPR